MSSIDMIICVTSVNMVIWYYVDSAGKVIIRPRSGVRYMVCIMRCRSGRVEGK